MKKAVLFIVALLAGNIVFAQASSGEVHFWEDPMLPFYIVIFFIALTAILIGVVGIYLVNILNMLANQAEKASAAKLGIAHTPKQSLWSKLIQRLNASVPVSQEKDIVLDHDFDGIKELDNHLPPWWKWLFYGTIGWAIIYVIVFHFMHSLPLSEQEYEMEVAFAKEQEIKRKAAEPETVIDESTLEYTHDVALIEKGKNVFLNNSCGSCHRNDGGGNTIGPNLTDEYWLHGGDVKNVFATIKNGVVEKGMPAWGKSMSPEDVRNVTFFVMSLNGTKPENAKAPQGELFEPSTVEKADSVTVQAAL